MAELTMGDYPVEKAVRTIMSPINKEALRKAAYELYKAEWLERHTTALQQTSKRFSYIDELIKRLNRQDTARYTLENYLQDVGYDGSLYGNYVDFLQNEYADGRFMTALLKDYERYKFYKEHDDLFATK